MSSAFAEPVAGREHVATQQRYVVVIVDAPDGEVSGARVARVLLQWDGTVATGNVDELEDERPDAVVLIADTAGSAGMTALRRVRKRAPDARVIVVARDDHKGIAARHALNAGAEAFVRADEMDRALRPAVDAVIAGLVCAPRATRRVVAKPTFSHREKEVLALLVGGLTNRQIAARLFLAESTVKTHLVSAFAKLGVAARKDAVALLLDPAEDLWNTALQPASASRGPAQLSAGLQKSAERDVVDRT
jgi:DNA-binding NarL/FixJ family response regulator